MVISVVLLNRALCIGLAAALLAGCGEAQTTTPGGFPGAPLPQQAGKLVPQTSVRYSRAATSGMSVYVAGNRMSYVLSYPKGELVGTIDVTATAACSDRDGNVFFAEGSNIVEYAHGGTTPIATLGFGSSVGVSGCSVDATSGNLGASIVEDGVWKVAIFQNARGTPAIYESPISGGFCGYDNRGNLFVDGFSLSSGIVLAELPNGGTAMFQISLGHPLVGDPWQVQWDGKYVAVEGIYGDAATVYRLRVSGSEALLVGTTSFNKAAKHPRASWIQGKTILLPYGPQRPGGAKLGFWKYPAGGKSTRVIQGKNIGATEPFNAVTVSVSPAQFFR